MKFQVGDMVIRKPEARDPWWLYSGNPCVVSKVEAPNRIYLNGDLYDWWIADYFTLATVEPLDHAALGMALELARLVEREWGNFFDSDQWRVAQWLRDEVERELLEART